MPVWHASQAAAYPTSPSFAGLFSSNPTRKTGPSGIGAELSASYIGVAFGRSSGSFDAYIEIPSGSDYTWLFETDGIGYVGSNPGFVRNSSGSGGTFLLLPPSGLWVRQNGTDLTSSVAAPPAGSTVRCVVTARSGVSVKAWINGQQVLNSSTASTTAAQTSTDGYNFLWRHNVSEYLTGQAVTVGLWHRALSDRVARALSESVSRNAYEPQHKIFITSPPILTTADIYNLTSSSVYSQINFTRP